MSIGDEAFTKKKEKYKKIRTFFEVIILIIISIFLINMFFTFKIYTPFQKASDSKEDTGFIALSYFGVERIGDTSNIIGNTLLRQHLEALKSQGYETITQQDIIDYYQQGKKLPPKALFLMFEDGRRDTAIFAQDILEDLNYKATMMTYPEKFNNKDPKFLLPQELKDMEDSTFWEMGTNGYRLKFINTFDRYDNFLGELTPLEYAMVSPYLGRKYNHYLMDFIRDKEGFPVESVRHMELRIGRDYKQLRDIYTKELGYVPKTYVLMHANTGRFGNSPRVSNANEYWIKELFSLNFNREGYCFNQGNIHPLDLTRMQPQAYWPVNHLLMRIKYDINQPIEFYEGDKELLEAWEITQGVAEGREESLLLTSLPTGWAIAKLKEIDLKDSHVSLTMEGNAVGSQRLLLRTSPDLENYVAVELYNGYLLIFEKSQGKTRELYKEKLSILDGEPVLSIPEDKQAAEIRALETKLRYTDNQEAGKKYMAALQAKKIEKPPTVEEGAAPYEGILSAHRKQNRKVSLSLQGDELLLSLDDKKIDRVIKVSVLDSGNFYLQAGWDANGWSQRNLADDVYDGIFSKINIYENTGRAMEEEKQIYTSEFTGWRKTIRQLEELWEQFLSFFLKHL